MAASRINGEKNRCQNKNKILKNEICRESQKAEIIKYQGQAGDCGWTLKERKDREALESKDSKSDSEVKDLTE